ncbi:LysR substrate-binding domain-containing protein [Microbacterium elymi]|uniref:LysR substrate-binding domain-containing protein n=1 Tax=Microbacterium elymi TaxID=2909587 RepID=A0ABY5NNF8_9MICO|nr:LysR substrate-binding domain-containing protein [Microbacterium elymi]UUT36661.1 LysR substrate-binding domain-containing protein [Microbacterium elymi]
MDSLPVLEMQPRVLVAADHRLAHRKEIRLDELADDPLIRLDIPTMTSAPKGWNPHWPQGNASLSTSNVELLRALVGRGLGYALVGQGGSPVTADGRAVVALRVRDEIPPIRVVIAFARGANLSRAARGLVDFVRELSV